MLVLIHVKTAVAVDKVIGVMQTVLMQAIDQAVCKMRGPLMELTR